MFSIGSIVAGKYRVERELGRGGMGMVVAAHHIHLGTTIALKFLNDQMMAEPSVVARFLREARASAQLRSEHICRVLDFGTEGEVPYIVMELLEGTDLAKLVRQRALDVATASEYVIQACIGLAEAHAAQIVHRDLKPSNLFLTRRPDGSPLVKVFDFGVAKAPQGVDINLTQTSSVVGSPGYMSPEQVRSSRNVDQRSDIWALGIILYKLTSTRMPFKAESITDLAVQIAMDPAPPLPEVPPAFEAIVMKCLEKDAKHRYPDVMSLVAALSPFTGAGPRDTMPFQSVEPPRLTGYATVANGPLPTAAMTVPELPQHRDGYVQDSPTTLRGATGALERSASERNYRPWVIGAVLSAAIGIVIGLTWTKSSTAPAPAGQPTVKVDEPAIVEPKPEPVERPRNEQPASVDRAVPAKTVPAIGNPPGPPVEVAKPVDKRVKPVGRPSQPAHVVTKPADPTAPPHVDKPAEQQQPKDIGASRI